MQYLGVFIFLCAFIGIAHAETPQESLEKLITKRNAIEQQIAQLSTALQNTDTNLSKTIITQTTDPIWGWLLSGLSLTDYWVQTTLDQADLQNQMAARDVISLKQAYLQNLAQHLSTTQIEMAAIIDSLKHLDTDDTAARQMLNTLLRGYQNTPSTASDVHIPPISGVVTAKLDNRMIIHALANTKIRAPFACNIAYVGRMGSLGQIIVLSNHSGHKIAINGNFTPTITTGDTVAAGKIIGLLTQDTQLELTGFNLDRLTQDH